MKRNTDLELKVKEMVNNIINLSGLEEYFKDELDIKHGFKHKLLYGVNYLVDMIAVTLGAKGRTVLYNDINTNKPRITKDGVTVANNVTSEDVYVSMAIDIVKEASQQTVKSSGDGTTTTAIFARYLVNVGTILMEEYNLSYYDVANLFNILKDLYITQVNNLALNVEDNFDKLLNIATVSANSSEIGELLFNILKEIGIYGFIEVKKSSNFKDKIETVKGIKLHKGFMAPQFANDKVKMQYKANNVFIVMINDTIRDLNQIYPYMKLIDDSYGEANHNILFLVNDVESTLLDSLVRSKIANPNFNLIFVENDGFGDRKIDILNTISALTGGDDVRLTPDAYPIGYAEEVIINSDFTSILNGRADEELISFMIEDVEYKLTNAEELELDNNEIQYLKKKQSFLKGGAAVIHVGGTTEVEMIERKDRIDDAVEALRAAVNKGVCIGGGYTLNKIYNSISYSSFNISGLQKHTKFKEIIELLCFSILEPLKQLCINSDYSFDEVLTNLNNKKGYDAISNNFYPVNKYKIYDPAGVLIDSFSNAIAVAKSILSIKRSIYN